LLLEAVHYLNLNVAKTPVVRVEERLESGEVLALPAHPQVVTLVEHKGGPGAQGKITLIDTSNSSKSKHTFHTLININNGTGKVDRYIQIHAAAFFYSSYNVQYSHFCSITVFIVIYQVLTTV
jgi:hypothetical protein